MGITLTSKSIASTYDGLLKLSDNDPLSGAFKVVTDGFGNDTGIQLNNAGDVNISGILNVGTRVNTPIVQLTGGTGDQGTLSWNADEETVDLIQNGTTLQLGQGLEIHVKNQTGTTIPKGAPVRAAGTLGASGRILIAPMIADGTIEAKYFLGVANEAIANGEDGKVITFGKIRGIDTSAYSEGQTLWVSSTSAGNFQTTRPLAPNLDLEVAIVINSSVNNGTIFVRSTIGHYIGTAHDVNITSVAENDLLVYKTNRWVNSKTIGDLSAANVTLSGYLRGPATFVIDPAAYGNATGLVQILGDLRVDGTTTTINSTTLDVADKNITIAKDAVTSGDANGAGITIAGANATLTYLSATDDFTFNKDLKATEFIGPLTGNVTGTVSTLSNHDTDDLAEGTTNLYFTTARARAAFSAGTGVTLTAGEIAIGQLVGITDDVTFNSVTSDLIGNADTATKLAAAVNIALTGSVTGNANFDGSGNISIATTTNHNHDDRYYTETEVGNFFSGATAITGYNKTNWDAAYNDKINSAAFNTGTGVITLTQQDAGTVTVDIDGRFLPLTGGTLTGALTVDDKITITGTNNNLVIDESATNVWSIYDTFQNNGIILHSGSDGMEFQYNGVTQMTIDGAGITFSGTLSFTGGIGTTDSDIEISTTGTATRGIIWNDSGLTSAKIVSAGSDDGKVTLFTNMTDSITGGTVFEVKEGSLGTSIMSLSDTGVITASLNGNASTATKLASAVTINGTSFDGSANITTTNWGASRSITLTGDVTGTVASYNGGTNLSIATTIAANSVALGTDTTGNYVAGATAGQGITITGTAGEGWSPTIALTALDLTLFPTSSFKKSVKVATTANITLSGTQTIDGIAVVAGDRVLVKDQSTNSANGIYIVAAGSWTRATDADGADEITNALVAIDQGTTNGGQYYTNTFKSTDTVGTTAMPWFRLPIDAPGYIYQFGISGNAATATSAATLTTARLINGTSFNGSADITTTNWGAARSITLTGDVTGSVASYNGGTNLSIATTIAANSVALGTDTTGNYVGDVTAGTGISIGGSAGEGTSRSIGLIAADLTLFPTSSFKKSVKVATTGNITLSAPQTIDGISCVAGDRVLVKDQTTNTQNGIYVVAAAAWARATDADASDEITNALVAIDQGTTNGGQYYTNTFKTTDVVGTTAMPWFRLPIDSAGYTYAFGISGNAGTATKLATARAINGVNFDGTAAITITANTPNTLTRGTYLTGSNFNGSAATTWAVDATSANTASKVVARDASGNFSAGTITAALSGNASTATTLQTARTLTIGSTGKSFNGSANVSWSLAEIGALPLTGGTLSGALTTTSLTVDGTNDGTFGYIAASWAGSTNYPTLYSASTDRWVMHINPHISYVQNGVNGFTGSMSGATIRMAGQPAATTFWDLGVGTNSVGNDKFSIGRSETSFLAIDNLANVGIGTTSPAYKLDVNGTGRFTGTLTATLSGNATTATTLQTARTINDVSFDGSANIIVEPYVERDDSTNALRYLTFVDNETAGYKRLNMDNTLMYNPSTNTFIVNGNLSGTLTGGFNTSVGSQIVGSYTGAYTTDASPQALLLSNTSASTAAQVMKIRTSSSTSMAAISFWNLTTLRGHISVTGTGTTYNTVSDYRLKENVVDLENAAERVMNLKPRRFSFIGDNGKMVDGFLAHEAQEVVPEAVEGQKDAVDSEGNPAYQGIDQSKLIPLLTAALQDALKRIEVLEGIILNKQ